jgi:2,6-dihydroxypseudooxynicotine hydrolase
MSEEVLDHLWTTYVHRFLAEGGAYGDFLDARKRIASFDQWCGGWSDIAHGAEARADTALARGLRQTAANELGRAAFYYCFAQLPFWHDPPAKRAAYENAARVWRRAAPLLNPPLQPVAIPYRGIDLPGYMRVPSGVAKPACVVLLGGLDSTKEEMQVISDLCIARGLATLSFDGPGQGETFFRMKLAADFVDAVIAVFDFAEKLPSIDGSRFGIIGRSLGGYYAPRAAALDRRVRAAAAWGAMYHLRNYRSLPPLTAAGFVFATGAKNLDGARPYLESIDLDDVAGKIVCPLLIVHSGRDVITPTDNATLMHERVNGSELLFFPDSGHCVHDRAHICRPAMADFMRVHLAD